MYFILGGCLGFIVVMLWHIVTKLDSIIPPSPTVKPISQRTKFVILGVLYIPIAGMIVFIVFHDDLPTAEQLKAQQDEIRRLEDPARLQGKIDEANNESKMLKDWGEWTEWTKDNGHKTMGSNLGR
jgi:hypothetical protein